MGIEALSGGYIIWWFFLILFIDRARQNKKDNAQDRLAKNNKYWIIGLVVFGVSITYFTKGLSEGVLTLLLTPIIIVINFTEFFDNSAHIDQLIVALLVIIIYQLYNLNNKK